MKKSIFSLLFLAYFLTAFSEPDSLYNAAIIGQSNRNQKVGKGLQVGAVGSVDTLQINGKLQIVTGAGANKILTSSATGMATWQTNSSGTLNLQQVTTNGNVTNNSIYIPKLLLFDSINSFYNELSNKNGLWNFNAFNGKKFTFDINGLGDNTTRSYEMPTVGGVFAMSVNGEPADAAGDIALDLSINPDSIGKYAWRLTGNSGTNPATNFIGTTDYADLHLGLAGNKIFALHQKTGTYMVSVSDTIGSNIFEASTKLSTRLVQVRFGDLDTKLNGTEFYLNDNDKTVIITDSVLTNIGKIQIVDGTQANGYVLTSDANGLASWQGLGGSNGSDIPAYANNAAAFAVLGAGKLYYTDVAGEYIIKVTH
jgi:hypothetical protein